MILIKGICGGVIGVLLAWVAILATNYWRVELYNRKHGVTGLGATAGGWNFLLQLPMVVVVLSAAFGIGLYVTARWAVHP